MAKQTFTTGQVLTAAQMTSLQQTAMLGGAASAKTASYTLVAADAGTAISMSNASATTITVNTALFAAGDTVQITNLGAGVCTITAGTATVNTAASLALAQYESGTLDFTSTSAAIFIKGAGGSAASAKVLQVINSAYSTATSGTTSYVDSGITATITPTLNTSKILVFANVSLSSVRASSNNTTTNVQLRRGTTTIANYDTRQWNYIDGLSSGTYTLATVSTLTYMDSPATTSATTYTIRGQGPESTSSFTFQPNSGPSAMVLMEIGA
jgi:hypothetical protein